jgi:hypothetical protein
MKRPALAVVALCLVVGLVSWAPAASASTNLDLDARSNASSLTVPGDTFFPESIAATPAGTLFVGSVVTGEILRFSARLDDRRDVCPGRRGIRPRSRACPDGSCG